MTSFLMKNTSFWLKIYPLVFFHSYAFDIMQNRLNINGLYILLLLISLKRGNFSVKLICTLPNSNEL